MKIVLQTNLKHCGQKFLAGECIDTDEAGFDAVQVEALLSSGSAVVDVPATKVKEDSELAGVRAQLEAANAANEELRRELSALRAAAEKQKPLADENDPHRKKAAARTAKAAAEKQNPAESDVWR